MQIKVPAGVKALDVSRNVFTPTARAEQEVVLDRGGQFHITGYHYDGKHLVLESDYAPRK